MYFSFYYAVDEFLIKGNASWSAIAYLALSVWWMLTIVFFRDAQRERNSTFRTYKRFALLMFAFYIAVVFYSSSNISAKHSTVSFARVGYIYHVLAILPLLLLDQNRIRRYCYIGLAIVVSLFSFKRGAIIVLPLMLFAFFFSENRTGYGKHKLFRIVIAVLAFLLAWYAFDRYSGGYLSRRFTREALADGSGRANLISTTLDNISHRNFLQLLFGIRDSSELILSVGAHNEWIVQLEQSGIIGVALYAKIILALFWLEIKFLRKKSVLAASFSTLVVFTLCVGLVSGWYYMHSSYYIMIYIGIVVALSEKSEDAVIRILTGETGEMA